MLTQLLTHPKRSLSMFAAFLPVLICSPLAAQSTARNTLHSKAAYGKVPLYFEQNQGQAEAAARFVAHGLGYSIELQPAEAKLVLHSADTHVQRAGTLAKDRTETVRLTMVGANPAATMTAQQPTGSYVNYMTGANHKDWHIGVPTSLQARTTGLYPGIDVVYYGDDQRTLEYDFTVAPGADAAQIRMAVTGAKPVLAADGTLRLQAGRTAAAQDLSFGKPVVYQQIDGKRRPVEGSFNVTVDGEVGFKLGTYDHARELVIDPIISYAGYFGGSGYDYIYATALNAAGQLYAVGYTKSLDLPGTTGEFQPVNVGTTYNNNYPAGFVTKFSADGSTILWTTYLSGIGDSVANGVAVNAADQPYIVGYTFACGDGGTNYVTAGEFPFVGGVQPLCNPAVRGFNNFESNGGNADAFLVKLSADGKTELYGTPLGGSANDIGQSVALDASGKVYIVGQTISTQYAYAVSRNLSDVPAYPIDQHGNANIGTGELPDHDRVPFTPTPRNRRRTAPPMPMGNVSGPQDEQAFLTVLSADLNSIVYSLAHRRSGAGKRRQRHVRNQRDCPGGEHQQHRVYRRQYIVGALAGNGERHSKDVRQRWRGQQHLQPDWLAGGVRRD